MLASGVRCDSTADIPRSRMPSSACASTLETHGRALVGRRRSSAATSSAMRYPAARRPFQQTAKKPRPEGPVLQEPDIHPKPLPIAFGGGADDGNGALVNHSTLDGRLWYVTS